MAKKKAEQTGQVIGLIIALAIAATLLAAAVLPLFLLLRYLQHRYLSYRLRKDYDMAENGWWLSETERKSFKESHHSEVIRVLSNHREHSKLERLIIHEHKRAKEAGLPTTNFGTYSRHSNLGKEIQGKIDELESCKQDLDLYEYPIQCRQPVDFWNELNDLLKRQDVAFVALLGWSCGACFFCSAYQQGAPFGLWLDLFAPAVCAGVGAGLASLLSRNPAVRYMPKPVEITIDNVDVPTMELPQRTRPILKLAGFCFWLGVMIISGHEGSKYGAAQVIANREQLKREQALAAEYERQMQEALNLARPSPKSAASPPVKLQPVTGRAVSPNLEPNAISGSRSVIKALPVDATSSAEKGNLSRDEIQAWDLARVRYEINRIYARHGVVFPKQEIQAHFEKQSWYKPVPELTFEQAELTFSIEERQDIEALSERRAMLSGENQPQTALPASEPLNPDLVATWDAARVRIEINAVYARYGVDFTNAELRKWAEKQPGYKRVTGRTFADAEALFTDTDRSNIELLATRRRQISSGN